MKKEFHLLPCFMLKYYAMTVFFRKENSPVCNCTIQNDPSIQLLPALCHKCLNRPSFSTDSIFQFWHRISVKTSIRNCRQRHTSYRLIQIIRYLRYFSIEFEI